MNPDSALAKQVTLELLFGTVLTKHMNKTAKFPQSLMIYGLYVRAVITYTFNVQLSAAISDTFLIPSFESMFGDEVIFQNYHASCHQANNLKSFQERQINSVTWQANRHNVEVGEKNQSRTRLNLSLVKSMPQKNSIIFNGIN